MTTFFTSDTHFGHARIIDLCNRPFRDVDHMNEEIVRRWNSVVQDDDIVYHLGDVALGKIANSLPIVSQLNGQKILVIGNHDRIFQGEKEKMQQRFIPEYNRFFFDYYDHIAGEFTMNGDRVNLSHFPYDGDSHGEDRYANYRLPDEGVPLIHGHTHSSGEPVSRSAKGTLQIHVGVDAWNYYPVPESMVEELIKENL